ncbi:MAG: DUF5302 domain-containing protein [Micrococcales bacterium]|nr:DUF5302 domain-containing protein [Micrococcales bacterium]
MTASDDKKAGRPSDEAKERFRQALEAKKARSHRAADGVGGDSAVHGSETSGPVGPRQFRRKSGS